MRPIIALEEEMTLRRALGTFGILAFILPQSVLAADATAPTIDRIRGFLIYEDTGDLSKNLAKTEDQIVANDEKGTSIQMLVDVVLSGKPNSLYENNPRLHVVARSNLDGPDAPALVDKVFYLTFIAAKGELVRTVVVDHGCNGFDLEAYVMDGDNRVS
jgi:hypothetical protein